MALAPFGVVGCINCTKSGVTNDPHRSLPMITKNEFMETVKPVVITINGVNVPCEVREFSTGSVGFVMAGKVAITLPDGSKGELVCNGNLVMIGSKKWEQGDKVAA